MPFIWTYTLNIEALAQTLNISTASNETQNNITLIKTSHSSTLIILWYSATNWTRRNLLPTRGSVVLPITHDRSNHNLTTSGQVMLALVIGGWTLLFLRRSHNWPTIQLDDWPNFPNRALFFGKLAQKSQFLHSKSGYHCIEHDALSKTCYQITLLLL